ncbi:MAG TPA: tetratricopeptide repeat protein [Pyrinomonadaceae bacterium]|nr:tetratricopeptide repeat protein [Pyrinomonadaceae bacterium]
MILPVTGRALAHRRFLSYNILLAALVLASASLTQTFAQGIDYTGTGGRHSIQGRIFFPSGRRADITGVKVKLESTSNSTITVYADVNGTFTFKNLVPGSYTVVIEAGDEYEVARENVYIDEPGSSSMRGSRIGTSSPPRIFNVPVYLMAKRRAASAPGAKPGVINAALADVPKAAIELFDKALQSAQAGDSRKAIEQLKAAISYYPSFALALNELGVQYLKLNDAGRATEALQSAVKLTPDAFTPRLNYGIALLEKKELAEAEAQLRQALKKNDASWPAHMYLGLTLLRLRRYDESEKELQRTLEIGGDKLGMPYYYLGGIYWNNRQYKRAADALEKYLQLTPKAPDAERIRGTIKALREKEK